MPTALVTGASGFVGSHLCAELVSRGWHVIALVRPTSNRLWLEGLKLEIRVGDVSDRSSLSQSVQGADYVFHAAGVLRAQTREEFDRINRRGTENLLWALQHNPRDLRKLVLISTLSAAGPNEALGLPVSLYGQSKRAAELAVLAHAGQIPVEILRLPATYGPADRDTLLVFKLGSKGLGLDTNLRFSLCYVTDAVRAAVELAQAALDSRQPVQVCDGAVHTWPETFALLGRLLGRKIVPVPVPKLALRLSGWLAEILSPGVPVINRDKCRELTCSSWICDNALITERTGFVPSVTIEAGLALTLSWYRQAGWLR